MGVETRMHCDICAGRVVETVGTADDWLAVLPADPADERRRNLDRAGRAGWAADFVFRRCAGCGAVHVDPLPDAALLGRFYAQYHGSGGYAAKGPKKIRRALRRITGLRRAVAGRSFLDIGCNLGFAVEAARQAGFAATGIDIDADAVAAAARQFPQCAFHAADIATTAARGRRFDLVQCAEVLEHVGQVQTFAAALAALVSDGGLLYLTTPDAGHWRVRHRFLTWPEVKPPEHIRWYTKTALRHVFEAAGFRVERFRLNLKPGIRMLARRMPDATPKRQRA
jgi:SAM-dependent methyltransferase